MRKTGSAALLLLAAGSVAATPAKPLTAEQWEREIRIMERGDARLMPKPGRILFVGSSSIRMWRTLAADFPELDVINRGFGGAQIPDVTYFAHRIVMPHQPARIVFYAGDNDLSDGRTPEQVAGDFRTFVMHVREALPGVPIVFLSIKPSPARAALQDRIRAANAAIQEVIQQLPGLSYVDVFTPMLDENGKARPELYETDGLHLSAEGYRLWRTLVRAHLLG